MNRKADKKEDEGGQGSWNGGCGGDGMVKVGNGNRLGDLEEVQEEMVEPELMVGRREERWQDAAAGGGGNS